MSTNKINYDKTIKYLTEKFDLKDKKESKIKLPIDRLRGLTEIFRELDFKVGAEIGTATGYYAKWIGIKVKNPKLFLIDPYKSYDGYVEHFLKDSQKVFDDRYKKAKERLAKFNCEFVKKSSMEALEDFNDNSLDFVFIDGNHTFEYVVNDIAEWSKKVKPGGIISGHDYSNYMRGVKTAVDTWAKIKRINPWFIAGKGFLDSNFCWLWVKK